MLVSTLTKDDGQTDCRQDIQSERAGQERTHSLAQEAPARAQTSDDLCLNAETFGRSGDRPQRLSESNSEVGQAVLPKLREIQSDFGTSDPQVAGHRGQEAAADNHILVSPRPDPS